MSLTFSCPYRDGLSAMTLCHLPLGRLSNTLSSQSSTVVLTLMYRRPAIPMEKGKIGGIRTPKSPNRLSQNLAWVIMSSI